MTNTQAESRLVFIFHDMNTGQFFASHPLCPPCGLRRDVDDESILQAAQDIMEVALSGEIVGRSVGLPILLSVRDLIEVDGIVLDCRSVLYQVTTSEEDFYRLKILPEDHPQGREPLRVFIRKAVEAAEPHISDHWVVNATAA